MLPVRSFIPTRDRMKEKEINKNVREREKLKKQNRYL
jgi:hypothetical protein